MLTRSGALASFSARQLVAGIVALFCCCSWLIAGEVEFVSDPAASVRPQIASATEKLESIDKKVEEAKAERSELKQKLASLKAELEQATAEPAAEAAEAAEGEAPAEGTAEATEPAVEPAATAEAEPAEATEEAPAKKQGLFSRLFGSKKDKASVAEKLEGRISETEQEIAKVDNDIAELEASRIPVQAELDKANTTVTYLDSKVGAHFAENKLNEYQSKIGPLTRGLTAAQDDVRAKTKALGDLRQEQADPAAIQAAVEQMREAEHVAARTYKELDRSKYGVKVCIRESEQFNKDAEMASQKLFEMGVNTSDLPTISQLVDSENAAREAEAKAQIEQSTGSKVAHAIAWPFVKIGQGVKSGYLWVADKFDGE